MNPLCTATSFVVSSEHHTGARPSIEMCVGPELARCVHSGERCAVSPSALPLHLCCGLFIRNFRYDRIFRYPRNSNFTVKYKKNILKNVLASASLKTNKARNSPCLATRTKLRITNVAPELFEANRTAIRIRLASPKPSDERTGL
jgi:hypothetical protein